MKKKRAGGKFDFNWLGPYKITKSLGRGLYRLEKMDNGSVVNRVHGVHIKSYKMKESEVQYEYVCVFTTIHACVNVCRIEIKCPVLVQ